MGRERRQTSKVHLSRRFQGRAAHTSTSPCASISSSASPFLRLILYRTALHALCLHRHNHHSPQPRTSGKMTPFSPTASPTACSSPNASARDTGPRTGPNDGTIQSGCSILYCQPFKTTDLLNWRHRTPTYLEKPKALTDLLESIFQIHQPTWDDCHQLLLTLLSTEETRLILSKAQKWLQGRAGTLDGEMGTDMAPHNRPD